MNQNKIIEKIKKNYKNTELLLDIYLENYHNFYIYIRLDYYKKIKSYKLSWVDLTNDLANIENTISYEYIPVGIVDELKRFCSNINIKNTYELKDEYKVTINSYIQNGEFKLSFSRYIPKELDRIFNIMVLIFNNLPRKLNDFLQELGAEIIGNTNKYEYQEAIDFDLFDDDIDELFDYQICERGKDYQANGRVFFLEKIKDRYFAVVGGKSLYVIIIDYDSENKMMKMYCSCPCEYHCKHMYAVILAIRANAFRHFYKLTRKSNENLLDKVMNFNFLLSIGIDDQGNNYIIIEDGQIKLLPIFNNEGINEWSVLEDDKNGTLTKRLEEILK